MKSIFEFSASLESKFMLRYWLYILLIIPANLFAQSYSNEDADPEQQQLEWCFVYSNMLGFDVSYISNPRLYDNVSQWMGTPYQYAGQSMNGIDCSGLVCRLYRDSYDIPLQGSSRDLHKKTSPVKKEDLREGDLLFFKIRKSRISHVGVYLGKNKFAHASTSLGVIVSDMDDAYYKKYFYAAGRLLN
ncbi:MAG: C40 family peptidase [Bacteroidia bacterium]|nr:C40 family peptidase [Bacteroidia bacterium]